MKSNKVLKIGAMVLAAIMVMASTVATLVWADNVYDREMQLMAAGVATWTNTVTYNPILLKQVWIDKSQNGANTCTVSRVITSPTNQTIVIGTVSIGSTSNGFFAFTGTNVWLKNSDKLTFSSTGTHATSAWVIVEYQIERVP